MDVLNTRSAGVVLPRSTADGVGVGVGAIGTTSLEPLSPRWWPASAGGFMPSDDELLERTLAFSGSYVSDDGNVTVRRAAPGSFEYSGDRFLGHCTVCSRASLTSLTGEPLSDVRAAIQFAATHNHGDLD
ncbi:MAG: hypothetical protein ACXWZG_07745 [Microbacterium sp.]